MYVNHKLRNIGQDRFRDPSRSENFSFDISKSFNAIRMDDDGETSFRKLPSAQNSKPSFWNFYTIMKFSLVSQSLKTSKSHFYQRIEEGLYNVQGIYKLPLKDCVSNSLVLLVKSSRQNFNLRICWHPRNWALEGAVSR